MDVRLVVPELGPQTGGIGRYVAQLHGALRGQGVRADLARFRYLLGAEQRGVQNNVGEGAVVGVGSVVVRPVERFAVVVGNPSGVVRLRDQSPDDLDGIMQ